MLDQSAPFAVRMVLMSGLAAHLEYVDNGRLIGDLRRSCGSGYIGLVCGAMVVSRLDTGKGPADKE